MVEYILLVALIALAVIGAVTFLSQQTDSKFQDAGNKIAAAGTDSPCGAQGELFREQDTITGQWWVQCNGGGRQIALPLP